MEKSIKPLQADWKAEITKPTVCIIALKSQLEIKQAAPQVHLPFYQVTIDPRQCEGDTNGFSTSKEFIRFGNANGDELVGWQPTDEVVVFEELAEFTDLNEVYPRLQEERHLQLADQLENELSGLESIKMNQEQAS